MGALVNGTILGCDSEVFFLYSKGGSEVNELPHGLKLNFNSCASSTCTNTSGSPHHPPQESFAETLADNSCSSVLVQGVWSPSPYLCFAACQPQPILHPAGCFLLTKVGQWLWTIFGPERPSKLLYHPVGHIHTLHHGEEPSFLNVDLCLVLSLSLRVFFKFLLVAVEGSLENGSKSSPPPVHTLVQSLPLECELDLAPCFNT